MLKGPISIDQEKALRSSQGHHFKMTVLTQQSQEAVQKRWKERHIKLGEAYSLKDKTPRQEFVATNVR